MSKSESEIVDLEDRDPRNLSQHIQVSWSDIFGEPGSIRSPECAWSVSQHCFKLSRNVVYICFTVLCAPVVSCIMGACFACISFQYIWCLNPCLRLWKISCGATRNFVKGVTNGIVIPCAEACGYVLSQIRVRTSVMSDEKEENVEFLIV
ncbi:caveolin-2-like [Cylas formicarius]|uniref:caveolin-2-like n=1 Tax=Cylas formicarius TaxID=197179 RepID=UPI0029587CE1|nr:caveolin-2-like [Cylas formicarius]